MGSDTVRSGRTGIDGAADVEADMAGVGEGVIDEMKVGSALGTAVPHAMTAAAMRAIVTMPNKRCEVMAFDNRTSATARVGAMAMFLGVSQCSRMSCGSKTFDLVSWNETAG